MRRSVGGFDRTSSYEVAARRLRTRQSAPAIDVSPQPRPGCVGAACDPVCMDWSDGVDIGRALMPRRWKRYVARAFLAALVLFPNPAQRAMFWYAQE